MSHPINSPPPSPPPQHPPSSPPSPPHVASTLFKQSSWSPDLYREEAWLRRKDRLKRGSKSLTDEDLDELKACIELGFGFDSPKMDQRLSDTFPAYGLYYSVNKHYNDTISKPPTTPPPPPPLPPPPSSAVSECDTPSPLGSPHTIFGPGDNPQTVKTRLRQWAQVVACAVRQSTS